MTSTAANPKTSAASPAAAAAAAPAAPPKVDNAIRQYLTDIRMAALLEEFVAETVAERPDDLYEFMEAFARRKREELSSSTPWTLQRSWAEFGGKSEESMQRFADSFFDLLFTTQRPMRRSVFAKVADNISAAGLALAKAFDRFVRGDLSDLDLAALAAKHCSDVVVETYQYHAMVSTLLIALRQSMKAEAWAATSDPWREFTMAAAVRVEKIIADAVAAKKAAEAGGMGEADAAAASSSEAEVNETEEGKGKGGGEEEDGSPEAASTATATVEGTWDKMPLATRRAIIPKAFDLLFTQNRTIRRYVFEGVDVEALASSLLPLLEKAVLGTLSDEEIIATGVVARGVERGVELHHVQYGVTALLRAVSSAVGSQWGEKLADAWRDTIFSVGNRVSAMLTAALEEQKQAQEAASTAEKAQENRGEEEEEL